MRASSPSPLNTQTHCILISYYTFWKLLSISTKHRKCRCRLDNGFRQATVRKMAVSFTAWESWLWKWDWTTEERKKISGLCRSSVGWKVGPTVVAPGGCVRVPDSVTVTEGVSMAAGLFQDWSSEVGTDFKTETKLERGVVIAFGRQWPGDAAVKSIVIWEPVTAAKSNDLSQLWKVTWTTNVLHV